MGMRHCLSASNYMVVMFSVYSSLGKDKLTDMRYSLAGIVEQVQSSRRIEFQVEVPIILPNRTKDWKSTKIITKIVETAPQNEK